MDHNMLRYMKKFASKHSWGKMFVFIKSCSKAIIITTDSLNVFKHKGLKNNSSLIFLTCCISCILKAIGTLNKGFLISAGFYEWSFFCWVNLGKSLLLRQSLMAAFIVSLLVLLLKGTSNFSSLSTEDLNNKNTHRWIFLLVSMDFF